MWQRLEDRETGINICAEKSLVQHHGTAQEHVTCACKEERRRHSVQVGVSGGEDWIR
jgi:hypothetical protein